MSAKTTKDLLEAIAKFWTQSHHEIAQNAGKLLKTRIDEFSTGISQLGRTSAESAPRYMDDFDK